MFIKQHYYPDIITCLFRKLYEVDAFLLDQERSSMLPIMAAGLSSIIFSISTDASYLNTPSRSVEVPVSSPSLPPLPTVEVPPTQEQRFPPHQDDSYFANNSQPTQPSFTSRHVYGKKMYHSKCFVLKQVFWSCCRS